MRIFNFFHDRTLRRGFLWWLAASLIFYVISIVAAQSIPLEEKNKKDSVEWKYLDTASQRQEGAANNSVISINSNLTNWIFYLGTILIFIMLGLSCYAWFRIKNDHRHPFYSRDIIDVLINDHTKIHLKNGFIVSGIFIVIAILLTYIIPIVTPFIGGVNFFKRGLDNPGGVFAFVTGAGTLIGTYIAIQSVLEMKRTITSYPQLLDRLTELIKDAKDESGIGFVCYFPLPGRWQVKNPRINADFRNAIIDKERKVKIICLDNIDHLKFLITIARSRYKSRDEVLPKNVLEFQKYCDKFLGMLDPNDTNNIGDNMTPTKLEPYQYPPKRLPLSKMPGYYFFVSEHRAIIVTPVGIPEIDDNLNEVDIKAISDGIALTTGWDTNKKEERNKHSERVIALIKKQIESNNEPADTLRKYDVGAKIETCGFETTDRLIIQKLQDIFKDLESIQGT